MTLALRSADINGAKYGSHAPVLSCEPYILAKTHHAPVNPQHGTKAIACFHAFNSDSFGSFKETGLGEPNTYSVKLITFPTTFGCMHSHPKRQLSPSILPFSRTSGTCTLACAMLVQSCLQSSSTVIRTTLMLLAAPWFLSWDTPPTLRPGTLTTSSPRWNDSGLPSRTPPPPCFSMPSARQSTGASPCVRLSTSATAYPRPLHLEVRAVSHTPFSMVFPPTSLMLTSSAARPTSA
jgi:hypothetical protein